VPPIVFDAMGTLFDLSPIANEIGDAPLAAWFERTLHMATSLTLANEFEPFADIARAALERTIDELGLDAEADTVLDLLGQLPAYADAREAVAAAPSALVLTNGGKSETEKLLEQNGIDLPVVSVEEVELYKPHSAPYHRAAQDVGPFRLVAAHAWDILGARAAGYEGVWVNRSRSAWPFSGPEPAQAASLADAVATAVAS
jgi:2-haloacid dehalogenase